MYGRKLPMTKNWSVRESAFVSPGSTGGCSSCPRLSQSTSTSIGNQSCFNIFTLRQRSVAAASAQHFAVLITTVANPPLLLLLWHTVIDEQTSSTTFPAQIRSPQLGQQCRGWEARRRCVNIGFDKYACRHGGTLELELVKALDDSRCGKHPSHQTVF